MDERRKLVYDFVALNEYRQWEIADSLGLTSATDRVGWFKKATAMGLVGKLWEAVQLAHGRSTDRNPFEKQTTCPSCGTPWGMAFGTGNCGCGDSAIPGE